MKTITISTRHYIIFHDEISFNNIHSIHHLKVVRLITVFLFLLLTSAPISAQTGTNIWLENFNDLSDGTTLDNGTTAWSLQNTGSGTFSVQGNEFMASFNSANEGIWLSEVINISERSNVVISVDLRSATASTSDYLESDDYIRIYYKLDGGAETLIFEDFAGLGTTTNTTATATATSGYLNANTLQVIIKTRNSHSTERYYFDNIEITGTAVSACMSANASANGVLDCTDTPVTLIGSASKSGVSYNWTGPDNYTSSLQYPEVTNPGYYTLTVSDGLGCSATDVINLTRNTTPPDISASVSGNISCTNTSVTLIGNSTNPIVTYNWSGPGGFLSEEQNVSVNTLGTYTLTVTNSVNGCTSNSSVEVIAASEPPSVFWIEDFSLSNGTTIDPGPTGWSLQNSGSGTFSVQNNEFMASFNSANEGIWMSEIIDISTKSNVVVSVDLKSATASTNDSFESDDYLSVYYILDNGSETLIYEDFGGLDNTTNTTAAKTITSGYLNAGTLQVIIKARNSHSTERYYFDNIELSGSSQNIGPINTTISGPITCPDQNVYLTASINNSTATYYWIDPDENMINQQNPLVHKAGNYMVVVTVDQCQAAKTITVPGGTEKPDIVISGDHIPCVSDVSVTLSVITSNVDPFYSWSGPAGFNSTLQSPSVSNSGIYKVVVTDQLNLCKDSAFYEVQYGELLWNEGFDGLSDGTTEDLGTTGWSIDNSQIHTVDLSYYSSETGIPYYFEIRDNKLAAKSTLGEVVWTSHTIDISGIDSPYARLDVSGVGSLNDSLDCGKDCFDYDYIKVFYKIDGGPEIPFEKLGSIHGKMALPGIKISTNMPNGNNLQIIIKVYNTGNSEIFYFDNIQVLALGQGGGQVVASVSGPITCKDTIVTLAASPNIVGNTYNWSGPNGFTSDQPVTEVDQPGTYTLKVEGNTGCVISDEVDIDVIADTGSPNLLIDIPGNLTCTATTVTLSASSDTLNTSFTWSGFEADLNPVNVSLADNYVVTVTNDNNGCTMKDSITVVQDTIIPDLNIFPVNDLNCRITTVSLKASSSTPNTTFTWDGFAVGQNPVTATNADYYTVAATSNSNGCTTSDSVLISEDITPPGAIASTDDTITCNVSSVILSAASPTQATKYKWTGPDSYFSTEKNPVTSKPGEYVLSVFNPVNGCKSFDTIIVQQDNTPPQNVTASVQGTLSCKQTCTIISGSSNTGDVSYKWSGPNGYYSSEQNSCTFSPGIYTLVVTDLSNECSSSASVFVEQDIDLPPDVSVSVSGKLTCKDTIVTLTGSSSSDEVTYSWLDPNGLELTGKQVNVSIPGEYLLKVTNTGNGCNKTVNIIVDQDIEVPANLTASVNDTLSSTVTSVILSASSTTFGVTYLWKGPFPCFISKEQNTETSIPGNYSVTVTDTNNGCISEKQVIVMEE